MMLNRKGLEILREYLHETIIQFLTDTDQFLFEATITELLDWIDVKILEERKP